LETLEGVKEYGITKLHAFPFSDHHKGEIVPASLSPDQVPQEVKKERERRLLEV
jgi:tRNA A37 methylthiotransferase MiaB